MKELIKIQNELKVPKGNYNAFGKYKYRSAEQILEAVKPLLSKHECYLTLTDKIEEIAGIVYVNATATIYNAEGNSLSVTAQAGIDIHKKGMDISQCFGSSSSYSRKYALNGLFLIDETEADIDSKDNTNKSYLDDWKHTLGQCTSLDDLQLLFDQNKPTDKQIVALFTKRKMELNAKG